MIRKQPPTKQMRQIVMAKKMDTGKVLKMEGRRRMGEDGDGDTGG